MDVLQIVRDVFPISGGLCQLELAEPEGAPTEPDRLTVRLVVWEGPEDARQIRDIKEQQIWVGGLSEVDPQRLGAAVDGWRMALEYLFGQSDAGWLDCVMPHELVPRFTELVALRRPRSADDFAEALLASRQRLGRYLNP